MREKNQDMAHLADEPVVLDKEDILNKLASEVLAVIRRRVAEIGLLEEDGQLLMLDITEAMTFNLIMGLAEQTNADPIILAKKTKKNLLSVVDEFQKYIGGAIIVH